MIIVLLSLLTLFIQEAQSILNFIYFLVIPVWAASAVLFLRFVGKKSKEKKVNKVTQQAADQARNKSFTPTFL